VVLEMSIALNCMDKGFFALHSKDEPMIIHCILTIDGAVDPVRLKSALLTVLLRHPSLRSTIHNGLFRQVREATSNYGSDILTVWDLVPPQDLADANHSETGGWHERRLSEWMNRPLNPGKELPCRVLLLRKTLRESSLVFTIHHSAADGLHLFRFAAEVIQDYNGGTVNSSPSTYSLTDGRGDELVALAQACRLRVRHFYLRMVASLAHRFLLAPLSPNARICRTRSRPSAEVHFCQGSLNPHEVGQIRSRSKAVGATLNDALLAACFRTVEQWNDAHGKPSRKISIMVPVDISSPSPSPVTANQASIISVSTTRKERTDPDELLRRVSQKRSRILKNGIAFSIVYAAYFCSLPPPRMHTAMARFLMATQIYLDSVLLSNLGLIWPTETASGELVKMGDARITDVAGTSPVVSPMGISFWAGTYNDRLHVTLAYKASQFSHEEARVLLDLYLHELRSYQRTPEGVLAPEVRYRDSRETIPT
jgi:NRPS condensation-like uncharacterized protein